MGSRCRDLGLEIESYQPFRRAEGVTDGEFAEVLARFRGALKTAVELGTESVVVVSNTDPDAIGDRDHSAAQLAALASVAAEHGIGIMFEALSWGKHLSRVADAWDVLQRAGLVSGSLVVDTFHHLAIGDEATYLASIPCEAIGLVQLADAALLPMGLMQWSRNHRCFPGEGELDVHGAWAAVLSAGFDGPVSLEIFNPELRLLPTRQVAQWGADSLRLMSVELLRTTSSSR